MGGMAVTKGKGNMAKRRPGHIPMLPWRTGQPIMPPWMRNGHCGFAAMFNRKRSITNAVKNNSFIAVHHPNSMSRIIPRAPQVVNIFSGSLNDE